MVQDTFNGPHETPGLDSPRLAAATIGEGERWEGMLDAVQLHRQHLHRHRHDRRRVRAGERGARSATSAMHEEIKGGVPDRPSLDSYRGSYPTGEHS